MKIYEQNELNKQNNNEDINEEEQKAEDIEMQMVDELADSKKTNYS